jgi:hypothetical protein
MSKYYRGCNWKLITCSFVLSSNADGYYRGSMQSRRKKRKEKKKGKGLKNSDNCDIQYDSDPKGFLTSVTCLLALANVRNFIHLRFGILTVPLNVSSMRPPYVIANFASAFIFGTTQWTNIKLSSCLRFFRRVRKIAKKRLVASSCLSVRPPVRMEQLGSHWSDFHEIIYLNIFRNSVERIQVSLKSDKNSGYFTWSPMHICDHISLHFS